MALINNPLEKILNLNGTVHQNLDNVYLIDMSIVSLWGTGNWQNLFKVVFGEIAQSMVSNIINELGELVGLDSTIIPSVVTQVVNSLIGNNVGTIDDYVFRFRINPTSVDINRRKLQTVTEYGWGAYDLENFGDSFTTLSFSGTTGFLIPPEPLPSMGIRDIRLSKPYLNLFQLERFYKQTTQRLLLTLYGRAYMGYLEDLTFKIDGNFPTKIDYRFTFKAHPYWIIDIFTGDFTMVNPYNQVIWQSMSRPTEAMNLSNYGSLFSGGGMKIPG